MAACSAPDFFPAVAVALEHMKELDKQLKEDGVPFSPEASLHLTEITAAVTDLEADRRAGHEHLEVETIENSKLRHQIHNIRERMSQEILADVAAARASNAEEMDRLQKDLNAVHQLQEATVERQEDLLSQNKMLQPERERAKAEHEEMVASLNEQITLKYGLQVTLDQTQERIEELKARAAAVERDKITLRQNVELEREAFAVKQDNLSKEVDQVEGKIRQQKQAIKRSRGELDEVDDVKRESQIRLGELTMHATKLESDLRRLTASRCEYEEQLRGETQKRQELRQQRETLKKELRELEEAFSVAVQRLKEEIAATEDKIEESRAARLLCQGSLAKVLEIFKRQCEEESEVRAEHSHVLQQLERSKLQLEERVASIVKHRKEIKEMDRQIAELLEADTINKRVFERNQEEIYGDVDTEKRNIGHFEEEKRRLTALLAEAKRKQEEHVARVTSDIDSARRRYQELRQEEAALQRRQPKSTDADLLMSYTTQCEAEYRQQETRCHQEIERYIAEAESVARSNEEKQRVLEEKEEVLKEVEATWNEERSRHHKLKTQTSDLRKKRSHLEVSIQGLTAKTGSLLWPKERMAAELQEMQKGHMDTLDRQASEMMAAEMSIYDSGVKLEQVSVENSRLQLCIRQMTEGVSRAREDRDRYWQEVHRFKQGVKALVEGLQEAWGEDFSVTQDCQSGDGVLLVSLSATMDRLEIRRQQLGDVSTLLHQQMLYFSKRLGDKTTVGQKC